MKERQARKYEPSKLYQSFYVAGMRYHDGMEVVALLKPGDELELAGEFDNPYDPSAVALYCGNCMIGYVPSMQNADLAQLIYFGHGDAFTARIQQVKLDAGPSQQVLMGIYVRDARE